MRCHKMHLSRLVASASRPSEQSQCRNPCQRPHPSQRQKLALLSPPSGQTMMTTKMYRFRSSLSLTHRLALQVRKNRDDTDAPRQKWRHSVLNKQRRNSRKNSQAKPISHPVNLKKQMQLILRQLPWVMRQRLCTIIITTSQLGQLLLPSKR